MLGRPFNRPSTAIAARSATRPVPTVASTRPSLRENRPAVPTMTMTVNQQDRATPSVPTMGTRGRSIPVMGSTAAPTNRKSRSVPTVGTTARSKAAPNQTSAVADRPSSVPTMNSPVGTRSRSSPTTARRPRYQPPSLPGGVNPPQESVADPFPPKYQRRRPLRVSEV